MIYFVIGASGSGKTACHLRLQRLLPDCIIHDFDDIGVPNHADTKWRQEATEKWIKKLSQDAESKDICLLGQMVPAEIFCSPSAVTLKEIHITLLDCSDEIRIQRLKKRNHYGIDQNTLNWASWLRMHCKDPTWEPQAIKDNSSPVMLLDRWDQLKKWPNSIHIHVFDTTHASISQVSNALMSMMKPTTRKIDDLDTEIVFTEASLLDLDSILKLLSDDPLGKSRESIRDNEKNPYFDAFNRIQSDENAKILIASHEDKPIAVAQINFIQNLTYQGGVRAQIEGVRVHKNYRSKGVGKQLIQYLISLSQDRNCHMVQLTTDKSRPRAFEFYKSLGFVNSHEGCKLHLK